MTVTTLPTRARDAEAQDATPGRWRPTRAGILNVWRYYEETFEFHRGRLLLRGPNGTGKSKALELLLPSLLDASLRPSRLSTFGGSERTMHWNLMSSWDGTTRVGYVWVEFSRAGEDGRSQWFTCGARLSATANTRTVTPTYFTTDRRIGVPGGVALVNAAGRPLTRSDLAAAIGDDGVHGSAEAHRTTVMRTLFRGFSTDKYDALLSTLLQLRIPKLSEHLDPEELSRVLSQALPPLDHQDVAEIAEGFEKLDRRKETLAQLEREVEEARLLANRQRSYARRALRAAAAELTSATPRMDDITRRARERRGARDEAVRQVAGLEAAIERLAGEAHAVEQQILGLMESDAYEQGVQLATLRELARPAGAPLARRRWRNGTAARPARPGPRPGRPARRPTGPRTRLWWQPPASAWTPPWTKPYLSRIFPRPARCCGLPPTRGPPRSGRSGRRLTGTPRRCASATAPSGDCDSSADSSSGPRRTCAAASRRVPAPSSASATSCSPGRRHAGSCRSPAGPTSCSRWPRTRPRCSPWWTWLPSPSVTSWPGSARPGTRSADGCSASASRRQPPSPRWRSERWRTARTRPRGGPPTGRPCRVLPCGAWSTGHPTPNLPRRPLSRPPSARPACSTPGSCPTATSPLPTTTPSPRRP